MRFRIRPERREKLHVPDDMKNYIDRVHIFNFCSDKKLKNLAKHVSFNDAMNAKTPGVKHTLEIKQNRQYLDKVYKLTQ